MTDVWLPGVPRIEVPGGFMGGPGHVRAVVWHSTESSTGTDPAAIARYVIDNGSEYHVIWNPYDGRMVQLIRADRSARALRNGAGGYRTNRVGSLRVQIAVVGRAADAPLSRSPLVGWDTIRVWLRHLSVPEVDARNWNRTLAAWSQSGHTDHKSAPGNDHTDPGPIDFDMLFQQTPEPSQEEPMIIVRTGSKSPVFISGGRSRVITEQTAEAFRNAGVPDKKISNDDYQVFKAWSRAPEPA